LQAALWGRGLRAPDQERDRPGHQEGAGGMKRPLKKRKRLDISFPFLPF
jgi:hypothetical protein